MALAAHNMVVQDDAGNALANVTVEVRREAAGSPLVPIYSDRDGVTSLGNPFVALDGGDIRFHCPGGAYKITATKGALTRTRRYVAIGLAQETDLGGGDDSIEEFTGATGTIGTATSTTAVNRVAPSTTALTLPDASLRNGRALNIVDFSTSVTDHVITLTPHQASQKIMRASTFPLNSNTVQLGSVKLIPIIDPDDAANYVWIIAP